jgi:hypothetical protein
MLVLDGGCGKGKRRSVGADNGNINDVSEVGGPRHSGPGPDPPENQMQMTPVALLPNRSPCLRSLVPARLALTF